MAQVSTQPPRRWALLCGGDFYFDGTARDSEDRKLKFPHLGGCVRNVNTAYDLLVGLGVNPGRMAKLTASCGDGRPIEDESSWPTGKNIVRELDHIRDNAAPGDLVYIHYSCHGIRRDAAPPDPDGDSMTGAALVMTDVLRGGPYLTSYHLGVFIRALERKGLRVTLILDSCYSGRGIRLRGPSDARHAAGDGKLSR